MSFEVAAVAYDRFMGRWSEPLATQFADAAGVTHPSGPEPDGRVLDVGCGPGALTAVLVERLGAAAVSAVDPSAAFVAAARERLPGVDVRRAAADDLPYPDSTFAATLAQLVVHFLPDPVAGLRELARVTRPGGTVAACVWDFATGRGPTAAFWGAVHDLDPSAPDESERPGAGPGDLAALFTAAGLVAVRDVTLTVRLPVADVDDLWTPFTLGVGPPGAYVAGLDPAGVERLRERFAARLPTPPFTLDGVAWTAVGRAQPAH